MRKELWFGYKVKKPHKPFGSMIEVLNLLKTPPLCILQNVDSHLLTVFKIEKPPFDYALSQWFYSTGNCKSGVYLSIPFDNFNDAQESAVSTLGVNKFFERPHYNKINL